VLLQQARFDEAAAALTKAAVLLPAQHPVRAQLRQLQQRCQRYLILDARLPAILRGTEKAATPFEQLEFASLCLGKKLHAGAARLFAELFATMPSWAEDRGPAWRYQAACSAALAGCGRSQDAADQAEPERSRWRREAREWLRADLAAWVRWLADDPAARRAVVHKALGHWRANPNLACVRDAGELDKLPPDERKEFRALWADVAATLVRTEK
jgi:hypothetical protein